ncbi:MAG: tetratricopeptide repeat protein [Candidatus Udaeobacter sp.]
MRGRPAWLVAISFFIATIPGVAQQDDPSEIFLKAYLSAQQGEKLEQQDRFKTALAKYRFAGSLIEELRKSHAQWQPAVVEYRGRKISEAILRLQERITRHTQLTASANPLPDIASAAPESDAWSEPGPEALAPQPKDTANERSPEASAKLGAKNLRDKVAELQAALEKTRGDLATARKEKEVVDTRLNDTNSKLQRAENDLDEAKKSERQTRDQLTQLRESKAPEGLEGSSTDEQQLLPAEAAQVKGAVAAADEARVTAEKQRDDIQAKFAEATNHIVTLERERDDALSQLKSAKESEQHLQSLVAEKNDLQQKLGIAEENVRKLSEGDPKAAEKLAEMERQMAQLRQQLTETQNTNHYLAARTVELDVELEHTVRELQTARLAETNSEDSSQLARENELLRNIVVRERQEEVRRNEVRKLVLAELDRFKVRSDLLNKEIEFLAQPVTKLTAEELALFRQPAVSISNEKPGALKINFVFEKKSTAAISKSNANSTAVPNVLPAELQEIAAAARINVEQGKYRTAEKQYQTVLSKNPQNLDALSNLGVVYFRTGKIGSAESTLKKALTIAPDDDFVLTTLGIVHYRQSRFDEALKELRKAIELNPNSATAHNYLGITASQKGRQQEAEKEMLQAIAEDPNYADAHFNLAVILITTQPPSRELAKEHYARATALGTQPSPSLETLLQ